MQLQAIDWVVVAVYGLASLLIGIVFTKRAGRSLEQYFLSGRKLPWWLLGTSMVARPIPRTSSPTWCGTAG